MEYYAKIKVILFSRKRQSRQAKILKFSLSKQFQFSVNISGVENRNSERAYNYALGFADTRYFQGLYGFNLRRGIGPSTLHNKISDLVK